MHSAIWVLALFLDQVPWKIAVVQMRHVIIWLFAKCSSAHLSAGKIGVTPWGVSLLCKHVWHLKICTKAETSVISWQQCLRPTYGAFEKGWHLTLVFIFCIVTRVLYPQNLVSIHNQ